MGNPKQSKTGCLPLNIDLNQSDLVKPKETKLLATAGLFCGFPLCCADLLHGAVWLDGRPGFTSLML